MNDGILEARGVVKRFGPTEALRGVDLTIRGGELVAVAGPSGAGKSWLVVTAIGLAALGRAAPPVPVRTG